MEKLSRCRIKGIVLLWACLGCAQSSMVPNAMGSLDYQESEWNAKKIIENRESTYGSRCTYCKCVGVEGSNSNADVSSAQDCFYLAVEAGVDLFSYRSNYEGNGDATHMCNINYNSETCVQKDVQSNDWAIYDITAIESCTDGIQNQDETGVDCGGDTCAACESCTDGIQNQDETGVDCGGDTCAACDDWHWQEKIFAGDAETITCDNGARSNETAFSLEDCKQEAERLGFTFIFFQDLEDRPAGEYCHIYISCDTTREPSAGGTTYEFVPVGKDWNLLYTSKSCDWNLDDWDGTWSDETSFESCKTRCFREETAFMTYREGDELNCRCDRSCNGQLTWGMYENYEIYELRETCDSSSQCPSDLPECVHGFCYELCVDDPQGAVSTGNGQTYSCSDTSNLENGYCGWYDWFKDACRESCGVCPWWFYEGGFTKVEEKSCLEDTYGSYDTLDEAKDVCRSDKTCEFIHDHGCDGPPFYLCPNGAPLHNSDTTGGFGTTGGPSCIYQKQIECTYSSECGHGETCYYGACKD